MAKIYLRKVEAFKHGWCHGKNKKDECFFFNRDGDCPESIRILCTKKPIIFLKITRTEYNKLKKAKEKKQCQKNK